ncbi:MAG: shikimate dehydrogenase [Rhodospirillaceae bacterium]|nr:shikimate dehydrogenase [Rhodospirillaceae bacterium]MBL6930375.1 shikimate dehydrogenase [Rhodospirillales bacterium]MBL6941148.1 shikimate dehydrogenase [Rhodospirillales bacterium]
MRHGTLKSGVIGWPIDHSLSPRLYGFWMREHGINGVYHAIAVETNALPALLKTLADEGYVGLNVTVPHKEAVMAHLDEITDQARWIGAVNTIVIDEKAHLRGSNTDGFGFIENLKGGHPGFSAASGPAVVLGAGGAARAIVAALIDGGAPSITLANRTRARADQIADDLGGPVRVVDWAARNAALKDVALLVNTTTLGMAGKAALDISLDALPTEALVNDIVYVPLETPLLGAAKARGNAVVDGLGMLLHQGRPGFATFFGVDPKVTDDLRRYVLSGTG